MLPKLKDRDFLARQPHWYFLTAARKDAILGAQPLPAFLPRDEPHIFHIEMAPTPQHQRDGVLRLRSDEPIADREIAVRFNGVALKKTAHVAQPLPHPYTAFLGEPDEFQCFALPAATAVGAVAGTNRIEVIVTKGKRFRLIYVDVTLPV